MNKQPTLFDSASLQPVDLAQVTLGGPPLRVVYFDTKDEQTGEVVEDTRPCLVRCEDGERNIKTVRKLLTICGRNCEPASRTSSIPPTKHTYCNTCLAGAANGVLT